MQALLVTAYKNTEQLVRLIESTNNKFRIFIHVDKKSKSIDIDKIKSFDNVKVLNKYNIEWGGVNHLLAILDLLELALMDSEISYIHIISGQDILVKTPSEFEEFFGESNKIFMTCVPLNDAPDVVKRRVENWVPFANLDSRKFAVRCVNNFFYLFQRLLYLTRKTLGEFGDIYKGMVWCSFPRAVAEYVVECNNLHSRFMNALTHTIIPEEFFFQTIIMNSPYKNNVVPENLRYTDWHGRNGSCPAYLDETDYEKIKKSGDFFARKIDMKISEHLLRMLM